MNGNANDASGNNHNGAIDVELARLPLATRISLRLRLAVAPLASQARIGSSSLDLKRLARQAIPPNIGSASPRFRPRVATISSATGKREVTSS